MAVSIQEYKQMLAGRKSGKQKKNPEYHVQAAYVEAMAQIRPDVMIFSDTAAHIKKTMVQQMRANKLSTGVKWPDVFVAQPTGKYHGLYIEFKAESPFKVDGVTLKKNEHVEAQAKALQMLSDRGLLAVFEWDLIHALETTINYLNG